MKYNNVLLAFEKLKNVFYTKNRVCLNRKLLGVYVELLTSKVKKLPEDASVLVVGLGGERIVREVKKALGVKKIHVVCDTFESQFYLDEGCEVIGSLPFEYEWTKTMIETYCKNNNIAFDCVIVNPPFGLGKGNHGLHFKVVSGILDGCLFSPTAEIISIQPVNWLLSPIDIKFNSGYIKKYANLLERCKSVDFIPLEKANDIFAIEGNHLGVYVYSPTPIKKSEQLSVEGFCRKHGRFDDTGFFESVVCPCFTGDFVSLRDMCVHISKRGDYSCYVPEAYGIEGGKMDFCSSNYTNIRQAANGKERKVINFKTEEQAENFRHSLIDGIFYKYVNWCYKKNHKQLLDRYPFMGYSKNPRTGLVGYESEWTDEDLFGFFGMSKEVIEKAKENLSNC